MARSDGSIVITADIDVSQADKDLAKLKKSIKDTEEEIEELTAEKNEATDRSVFSAAELDAEKAKLAQMKKELEEIRSVAKDTSYSDSVRAEAKASIPSKQEEIADQATRVRMLQAEYNRTANAVDRYGEKIKKAQRRLEKQKEAAGELTDKVNSTARASEKLATAQGQAEKSLCRFNSRLSEIVHNAFIFAIIGKVLLEFKEWMGAVIQTSEEARQAMALLKGALLTLAQPLVEVLVPAFIMLVKVLTLAAYRMAQIVAAIFGTTTKDASAAAAALNKETEALDGVGKAAKDAAGSLAGFDEINTLTTEAASASETIEPNFDFDSLVADEKVNTLLDAVEAIGAALLAWKLTDALIDGLNKILALKGSTIPVNIALGLTLAAVGTAITAENIASILAEEYDAASLKSAIKEAVSGLMIGAGLMVMGASAWAIPVAVALVVAITEIIVNWNIIKEMWSNIFKGIGELFELDLIEADKYFTDAYTAWMGGDSWMIEFQKAIIDGVFGEGAWEQLKKNLEEGKITIGQGAFNLVRHIREILGDIPKWIEEQFGVEFNDAFYQVFDRVISLINGAFAVDWKKAWDGIKNVFKGICNGIITIFETAINAVISGVNWLISQMNKVKFDVPSWVPGIGGKSMGINIPSISSTRLPRLATGSVVPPNREFMAVLGDNKTETEVVSPLSTMKQALIEALQESGASGSGTVTVVVNLDGKEVARNQVKHINDMTRKAGKPVLLF